MSAKYGEYYKPAITAAKGVKTWPVWLTAILAIMPTSLEELQQNWPAVVVLLVATLQPMVQNYWKHSDKPQAPLWLLVCVLVGIGATGCAHDRLSVVERDPKSGVATFELGMTATSTVSKNSVLQNVGYHGEGELPWNLQAGQQAQQDTTQVLSLLRELLNVAAQIAPLYAPPAQAPAELPPVETE